MGFTDEQLKQQLTKVHGLPPIYRLRWRFEFLNKTSKFGGWNATETRPEFMAAFVKKDKLVAAIIEGERISSWGIKRFVEIEGQKYVSTEWLCAVSTAILSPGVEVKQGSVVGMSMMTDSKKITVYIDGQIKVRDLSDYEKKFKLKEHN